MRIFLEHHLGVSLSPLKVLFCRPSVFAYAVLMFEVVKESEEFCYFLRLWIVFQIEKLSLDVLQAWQAFYPAHPTDSDMPVSRVIVALEGSAEAFYVLLEDFGRAGAVVIEEVHKPGLSCRRTPICSLSIFLPEGREFGIRNTIKLNRQLEKVADSFGNITDI